MTALKVVLARCPAYVPEEVMRTTPSFDWKGEHAHIGPTHTANAVYKKIAGHSHCAVLALIAGVVQWGAASFASVRDVRAFFDLAQIHFLVMEPARHRDVEWNAIFDHRIASKHKLDAALSKMFSLARQALAPVAWLSTGGRPISNLFHLIYLTRHVLAPAHRRLFDKWLDDATARTKRRGGERYVPKTGNKTRDKSWGHPLPMSILEADVTPAKLLVQRKGLVDALMRDKNSFYAPAASYFDKLERRDVEGLRSLGVTKLADLVEHTEEELEDVVEGQTTVLLGLELTAMGMRYAARPKAKPAKAAVEAPRSPKATKPRSKASAWPARSKASAWPAFIPEGLAQTRGSFSWKGDLSEVKPTDVAGAMRPFNGHSLCATYALLGGLLHWGAAALASACDVGALRDLADIGFLVMDPLRAKDVTWSAILDKKPVKKPKEEAVHGEMFKLASLALDPERALVFKTTAAYEVVLLIAIVRHILPSEHKTTFDRWVADASKRAKLRGSHPYKKVTGEPARDKTWGHPLPPAILEADVAQGVLLARRAELALDGNAFYSPVASYFEKLPAKEQERLRWRKISSLTELQQLTPSEAVRDLSMLSYRLLRIELRAAGKSFKGDK